MDTPQLVESLKGKHVIDAACGSSHSACILDDGSLYTWGKGRYGRLGHNDHDPQYKPKQVRLVCLFAFLPMIPFKLLKKLEMNLETRLLILLVASSLGQFPAFDVKLEMGLGLRLLY